MDFEKSRIQPCNNNPRYWQYKGAPVVLLGGSNEDNLFQYPNLEAHLDVMAQVGANYIRNTMSDRDPGDVRAFARNADGLYDLTQWNIEYWNRFESLLRMTSERNIIVQIEVWDRFDHSRECWEGDPYNPKNNINYTVQESGLAKEYPNHPSANEQPFFFTVPPLQNNTVLLGYQQRFVDKMLSFSLQYDNVLYCMDNETSGAEEWSAYWAEYIREAAEKAKKQIELTEMWDAWELTDPMHKRTLDHPDRYSFCDISQNNQNSGELHWERALFARNYISNPIRPINTVKTYGANTGYYGRDRDAIERFCRHLMAGIASMRFHRPECGMGLNEKTAACIKSIRMLLEKYNIFEGEPDNSVLEKRSKNEAFVNTNGQDAWAIFFTDGGDVNLCVPDGKYKRQWLNILESKWTIEETIEASEGKLPTRNDESAYWFCLVTKS